MKHKTRKLFSIFLALVMVLGLVPAMSLTAQAAGTNKAIQLGAGVFADPTEVPKEGSSTDKHYTPNSYVYYGYWSAPDDLTDSGPIKWRVLDAEKANDGTTAGMFLLSEYLLGTGKYGDVYFEQNIHSDGHGDGKWCKGGDDVTDHGECVEANVYQGSDAQAWCSTFASNQSNFSDLEQAAMLGVDKTDGDSSYELYRIPWGVSSLTTADKVFFLSARELADYVGNYDEADGLQAVYMKEGTSSAGSWWLRSPHARYAGNAGAVDNFSCVLYYYVNNSALAARPAFNLNLDSVLFTSAAAGGKAGALGELSEIGDYTGSEWKLTLEDTANRSGFAASFDSKNGDVWTVKYSGAKADSANEFISALIKNIAGEVTYYGRLCEAESGGDKTVTVDLAGKLSDGDTLYVFNEQYNGDKKTDYASEMKEITPASDTEYKITVNGGAAYSDSERTNKITKAKVGEKIYLKYDDPPAGRYVNEITCDAGNFEEWNYTEGYGMPARDVTFTVNTANRRTVTFDLRSGSCELKGTDFNWAPYGDALSGIIITPNKDIEVDLDKDGKYDIWRRYTRDPWVIEKHSATRIKGKYTENVTEPNTHIGKFVYIFDASGGNPTYTVTFNANGGKVNSFNTDAATTGTDGKLTEFPEPIHSESFTFDGWYTEQTGGTKVDESYEFKGDTEIFAHWKMKGDINGDEKVNNKDITRLMRYVKYKDVDVVEAVLDVNGDGAVNNKDITRLMRYVKYKDVEIH